MPKVKKGKQKAKYSPIKRSPKKRKVSQVSSGEDAATTDLSVSSTGSSPPPSPGPPNEVDAETELDKNYEEIGEDEGDEVDTPTSQYMPSDGPQAEEATVVHEVDDSLSVESPWKIEDDPISDKCCDDGFTPGNAENLPNIDSFAVTEFLKPQTNADKIAARAMWQQSRELIFDKIGYVQIKRDAPICTVKCVVATKTSENNCVIVYNEIRCAVETVACDCVTLQCSHGLSALIWACTEKRPGTYWIQPVITREPESMTVGAIFGFIKKKYQIKNTVLAKFVKKCQRNEDYTPTLMKYYHEDEIIKGSMHNLMHKFKSSCTNTAVESFLLFCRENVDLDCVADPQNLTLETKQELLLGRITDALLYDVTLSHPKEEEILHLIEKISFPEIEENVEINPAIIECLENSLEMKIKKCGLIVSTASPIFAVSPYGITDTHVVYIELLKDDTPFNVKKLDARNTARMHLQMYVTNKQMSCFCAVHTNNRIDMVVVKYNQKVMHDILKKAAKFWQTHIYQWIAMD